MRKPIAKIRTDNDDLNRVQDAILSVLNPLLKDVDPSSVSVPTGTVLAFAGSASPSGFLLCDGSAVSRSTYRALFLAIGVIYGPGDGGTTFNLPDLRGQFIRGLDAGRGVDAGRALGTKQPDAMQGHWHIDGFAGANANAAYGVSTVDASGNINTQSGGSNLNHANTSSPITDGVNGTPRTAAETRPVNVALNYLIKT